MKLLLPLIGICFVLAACSAPTHLPQTESGLERKVSELEGRIAKLEEPPIPETVTADMVDSEAALAFLQTEESCQACLDYASDHQVARDEFQKCDRSWYFSSHMDTVCTFEMPWTAPSGKTILIVCPGFNNKYCPGPMFIPHTVAPEK